MILDNNKDSENYKVHEWITKYTESERIEIGEHSYTLAELADKYEGMFKNKIIHFGSCSTLLADEETKRYFVKKTRAEAISGYTTDIDFLASTALDLLYFEICQERSGVKPIYNQMKKLYPDLCDRLGFEIYPI